MINASVGEVSKAVAPPIASILYAHVKCYDTAFLASESVVPHYSVTVEDVARHTATHSGQLEIAH